MPRFTHQLPDKFNTDEEKWLKIFNSKAFIVCMAIALIEFFIYKTFFLYCDMNFSIIITIIIEIIAYFVTTVKIPVTWNLAGAGLTIDIIILRIMLRKLKRVIYVKNYPE